MTASPHTTSSNSIDEEVQVILERNRVSADSNVEECAVTVYLGK